MHTQMASILAMPSMPSMKLYKLSSHTKYSKPMALPNQTGASNKPKTLSGGIP